MAAAHAARGGRVSAGLDPGAWSMAMAGPARTARTAYRTREPWPMAMAGALAAWTMGAFAGQGRRRTH